ncbi:PD-(D/E)XK nuclease family protein [Candidatus Woesebacteria bacterium]|nr:PD-(D/E)XK nuclease family protein [Candidatus Woesebacteria bacterium]
MPDKYTATWVSHSSLSEFVRCPRAYYLKNVYRDPQSNRKIQLVGPPLSLGSAVHEVIESLSVLPVEKRFSESLLDALERVWKKYSGKQGGYSSLAVESTYKAKAEEMLKRVMANPGPVGRKAVKLKAELPQFWLSEADEILLCGKIDWLEYLPETDSIHIVDFKTGKKEESQESLQLPIYALLAHNVQKRKVEGASYWYLAFSDQVKPQVLPDLQEAHEQILSLAKQVKLARKLNHFKCSQETGCFACRPMEAVVSGKAEYVGVGEYGQDLYMTQQSDALDDEEEAVIL